MKVCVCVCMCVCLAACRRAHTSHHPKIWHGLLISPGLGTEPWGDPKFQPLGVPPTLTPSEIPWRVKNWVGASKQKWFVGGVCLVNFFFGASPLTRGPEGPPNQMGVYALRIGRGPANKSCSSGWVCHVKFYFWGAHPNLGPAGSTPPNGGICVDNFAGGQQTKIAPRGGFAM